MQCRYRCGNTVGIDRWDKFEERHDRTQFKIRRKNPDENCYAITSFYSDHQDTIATNRHESECGSVETKFSRNKMSTLKNT